MNQTLEIERSDWRQWLELFSRLATNGRIRLEIEGIEFGDHNLEGDIRLLGLDLATKGSEAGAIELQMEAERRALGHTIKDPSRVYILENDDGAIESMEIEQAGGGKVILYLEEPIQLSVPVQSPPPV